MGRLEAGIHLVGAADAAQEERGGDEQDEGKRHLPDQQRIAEADGAAAAADRAGRFP